MSLPPQPRILFFNKETRQPNVDIHEEDDNHIGFEILQQDFVHFLELKEDLSGWQYNKIATEQRNVTAQALRIERERYLIKTDYVPNMPDGEKKEKLLKYRQWLRDLPQLVINGYYQPVPCIVLEYDDTKEYPTLS